MNGIKKLNISDIIGASASGLCAIHCAVTPILFAAKPLLESTTGHHGHGHSHGSPLLASLDYVFLILSFVAVWYSSRHTSHKTLKWVLWIAWAAFAAGIVFEILEYPMGMWLMYAGSISLVIAHIQNFRYCSR